VNAANLNVVPLQKAGLCLDCEAITAAHSNCLACGSRAMLNISRILSGRRPEGLLRPDHTSVIQMSASTMSQRIALFNAEARLDRGAERRKVSAMGFGTENSA